MNVRRGLFRAWVVFSVVWIASMALTLHRGVWDEFAKANQSAEWRHGIVLMPVFCGSARGAVGKDYKRDARESTTEEGFFDRSWYEMPQFRELYPEHRALSDDALTEKIYADQGMTITHHHPWQTLAEAVFGAVVGPVVAFIVGWSLLWVFAGFRRGA